jgi:hypothetical protein
VQTIFEEGQASHMTVKPVLLLLLIMMMGCETV